MSPRTRAALAGLRASLPPLYASTKQLARTIKAIEIRQGVRCGHLLCRLPITNPMHKRGRLRRYCDDHCRDRALIARRLLKRQALREVSP